MSTKSIIKKDITPKQSTENFSWDKAAKDEISFFSDGTMNIAYNCIDRHADTNKTALIFHKTNNQKETYTFKQLKYLTNKFANVLESQNIKKGDRVFIFLPTTPERYIAFLGILKLGAIAGTMFAAFQEIALKDRLQDSQAKVIVTNSDLYPRIKNIQKDLPELEKIIIIDSPNQKPPAEENIICYNQEMSKASDKFSIAHMQKNDYSYMLYTSGTTGKPKGVVHAHYDILQAIITSKNILDIKEKDIYWCTADMGWVTGVVYGILGVWGIGATQVIYEGRFSSEDWYQVIKDNNVSVWYTAPTAIRMLMGSETNPKDYKLKSLRHMCSVGEPLNPEAIQWGVKAFGLPFHDTWWQTELGGISITNSPDLDIKPGSMGKPLSGIKAAIINEEGRELPLETEGILALKADTVPSLMKTIWNNSSKFNSYFKDQWYISGDRAMQDKDGYFWFIGRDDDVINTAGERIGPFEIESALVTHPDIVEAAAIGKPDQVRGEIIKAFIVTKPNIKQNEDFKKEIKQYIKKQLAGHAYPREIDFIDKLPKTRSGKIMRRILKAKEIGLPTGDTSTLENY